MRMHECVIHDTKTRVISSSGSVSARCPHYRSAQLQRRMQAVCSSVRRVTLTATRKAVVRLFAACALMVAMGTPLRAQTTLPLAGPGCENCLRVIPSAVLGDTTELGAVSPGRGLVQLDDGSFVHAGTNGLSRFNAAGKPVGRIGRVGSGPMEFRRISFVARTPGNSLVVFDLGNGRVSVIDPRLQQNNQFTLANPVTDAVVLPSGDIVANIHSQDLSRSGVPLHLLDGKAGTIKSSFGLMKGENFDRKSAWAGFREIALSPTGTIWSARRNRYVLEEWDITGRMLRQLERTVEWFRPYEKRDVLGPSAPPQPNIESIYIDSKGLIWVFTAVGARDWRQNIVPRKPMEGIAPGFEPTSLSGIYDTMVEIIDPDTRRVLVSQRVDGLVWGMLSDSLIFSDAQDEDGFPTYQLWRVDVNNRSLLRK